MRRSSYFSAGERIGLSTWMRLRKIVIWAFSSLSCALCRGRKNWTRKARSREKVAFIVQGSTTALE
jgi:hypothetical protein